MRSSSGNEAGGVVELRRKEAGFPAELEHIASPPAVIYIKGRLPPAPRVAVVGARKTDEYGRTLAHELGAGLATAGVCVVSGGAAGIDTAALKGCLEKDGHPVAVLGTGVDVAYPKGNRDLFDRVALAGCLLSEYAPGTPGLLHHFPKRNRIVSALVLGVVVVRAAEKSGSLITARLAAEQGKVLMAVPGAAGEALSTGVNRLIRRGARLVESAADVLECLSIPDPRQRGLQFGSAPPPSLTGDEKLLFDVLSRGSGHIDELNARAGLESSRTAALLLKMELDGLVEQKPGMIYSLCAAAPEMSDRSEEGA